MPSHEAQLEDGRGERQGFKPGGARAAFGSGRRWRSVKPRWPAPSVDVIYIRPPYRVEVVARHAVARLSSETRGLIRDSSILALGTAATTLGYMAQIALLTHLLGLREYGVFAIVTAFVAVVDRFFDVQVGETVIAFGAETLNRDSRRLAGIFQFGYVLDVLAGVAGFSTIVILAPLVGDRIAGSEGPMLFVLYGLTLLAATVETTSFAILRLFDRFGAIFRLTALREALRIGGLSGVLITFRTLESAIIVLVLLEVLIAILGLLTAATTFRACAGRSLWSPALSSIRDARRAMLGMTFHTNLIASVKLAATQAPTLVVGTFRGPVEAGIFKLGTAAAAGVGTLASPVLAAALPRFSRLLSESRLHDLRRLVAQSGAIAAIGMGAASIAVILLRDELLTLFGGREATAAGNVLILAMIAQGIGGATFWNTSLLYAARKANVASKLYVGGVMFSFPLLVVFTRSWGAEGAATARLLGTFVGNAAQAIAAVRIVLRRKVQDGEVVKDAGEPAPSIH